MATGLGLAACAGSPPARFYVLSSMPEAPERPGPPGLVLGSIVIPRELDRPQIATRIGPNRLDFDEYARWAAELGELMRAALRGDLAARLPYAVHPTMAGAGSSAPRVLRLEIDRFEGDADGSVHLDARWTVSATSVAPITGGERIVEMEHGGGTDAAVAAMSAALADLADRIAATLTPRQ